VYLEDSQGNIVSLRNLPETLWKNRKVDSPNYNIIIRFNHSEQVNEKAIDEILGKEFVKGEKIYVNIVSEFKQNTQSNSIQYKLSDTKALFSKLNEEKVNAIVLRSDSIIIGLL
jgi:hypothetical protein